MGDSTPVTRADASPAPPDDSKSASLPAAASGPVPSDPPSQNSWTLSVKVVGPAGPGWSVPAPPADAPDSSANDVANDGTPAFRIAVRPEDGVTSVRLEIERATGLAPGRQRLIFRGALLPEHAGEDRTALRDVSGLGDGMTVHLVPRQETRGAPGPAAPVTSGGGDSASPGSDGDPSDLVLSIDDILGALSIPMLASGGVAGPGTSGGGIVVVGGADGIAQAISLGGDGAPVRQSVRVPVRMERGMRMSAVPARAASARPSPLVVPAPSSSSSPAGPEAPADGRGRRLLRILRGNRSSSPPDEPASPAAQGLSGRLMSASSALRRMGGGMAGADPRILERPPSPSPAGRPPSLDALRSAFAAAAGNAEGGLAEAVAAAAAAPGGRGGVPEGMSITMTGPAGPTGPVPVPMPMPILPPRSASGGRGGGPRPFSAGGEHSLEHIRQGLLSIQTILGEVAVAQAAGQAAGQTPVAEGAGLEGESKVEDPDAAAARALSPVPAQANGVRRRYYRGQWVDCRDTVNQWLEATVADVVTPEQVIYPASDPRPTGRAVRQLSTSESFRADARDPTVAANDLTGRRRLLFRTGSDGASRLDGDIDSVSPEEMMGNADDVDLLLVHYNGWPSRWDEWVRSDSDRVRPFRSRTRHPRITPHSLPTPQSSYYLAPPTHLRDSGEDESADGVAVVLPELVRALTSVNEVLNSALPPQNSDAATGGGVAGTLDADAVRPLASLFDRVGRLLQDVAPRISSLARSLDASALPAVGDAAPSDPPAVGSRGGERSAEARDFMESAINSTGGRGGPPEPSPSGDGGEGFPSLANWLTSNILTGNHPGVGPGGSVGRIVRGGAGGGIDVHIHAIVTPSGFQGRGAGEAVEMTLGGGAERAGPSVAASVSRAGAIPRGGMELQDEDDLSLFDELYSGRPLGNISDGIRDADIMEDDEEDADASFHEDDCENSDDDEDDDSASSSSTLPELIAHYRSDSSQATEDEGKDTTDGPCSLCDDQAAAPVGPPASAQSLSNAELVEFYDVEEEDPLLQPDGDAPSTVAIKSSSSRLGQFEGSPDEEDKEEFHSGADDDSL